MKYPVRIDKFFTRDTWNMRHSELMAYHFSSLVRHNKKLQHLDMANTGLSEVFLFDMLPALRRTRSLLAFHVSTNPGITERLVEFYQEKLSIADEVAPCNIRIAKE